MPRFVIVGDRESGKTTFLGLLYAAQVKSGSAKSDAFRFHADYESLEEISEAFEQIMSGTFPDAATKEGIHGATYHLGQRPTGRGFLRRGRSRAPDPSASVGLHFLLMRNLDEEMTRYRRGSSFASAALRDVLESNGVVILVDSTKLGPRKEEPRLGAMGRYDDAVASLCAALQRSRLHGGRMEIHPIFIFSKFDSVDAEALRAAGVEASPPSPGKHGPRRSYAEALLADHLPKTLERIRDRDSKGIVFAKPSFFFSSVRTEPATADRRARIRLRPLAGGGWESDYSTDEYVALLEHLGEIAAKANA